MAFNGQPPSARDARQPSDQDGSRVTSDAISRAQETVRDPSANAQLRFLTGASRLGHRSVPPGRLTGGCVSLPVESTIAMGHLSSRDR